MIVNIERFIPKVTNVFLPQPGGDATFCIVEMLLPPTEEVKGCMTIRRPKRYELVVISRDGMAWEASF